MTKTKHLASTLGFLVAVGCTPNEATAPARTAPVFEADIAQVCEKIPQNYVYFAERQAIWVDACDQALTDIKHAESGLQFLTILERLLDDLYDSHISLNTNSENSPRLLPSGTDVWIEPINGVQTIVAVRPGSGAAKAGVQIGDQLSSFNQLSADDVLARRIHSKPEMMSSQRRLWALNAAVAGYRNEPRQMIVDRQGELLSFDLGPPRPPSSDTLITSAILTNGVGYIRFNNSLGNDETVSAFAASLDELSDTKGLVIDLRDTPGGGNTGVAEPILGRLVETNTPYQVTVDPSRGAITRSIAPTGSWTYRQPVIALVGRWTGSMGEGMAIGLDGMERADIMGDCMAGLAGGTNDLVLDQSGVSIRIPAYDLTHLDGTPRHLWCVEAPQAADMGDLDDKLLKAALLEIEETSTQ